MALKIAEFKVKGAKDDDRDYLYVALGRKNQANLPVYCASPYGLVACDRTYPFCLASFDVLEYHSTPKSVSKREIKRRFGEIIPESIYRAFCKRDGIVP